ncbi:hypothetical protein BH24ACT16_BH24ACT16_04770 [soil metagenome]
MTNVKDQVREQFSGNSREFEAAWSYLSDTDCADISSPTAVEDLAYDAERWLKAVREAAPGEHGEPLRREDRTVESEVRVDIGDYVRERAETFTEVAAALAESLPDVQRFRSEVLENKLLTNEEAERFYFGAGTGDRRLQQDQLNKLARWLAKDYHWREGDAAWFVLTGYAALIQPLQVKVTTTEGINEPYTARITLVADPSVDAKVVESAYRAVQRQVLGGDNRKLAKDTLEMARFVARRIRSHGYESLEERRKRWNEGHPNRSLKSRSTLLQAFQKLAYPKYKGARFAPYEHTPYQEAGANNRRKLLEGFRRSRPGNR